VKLISFISTKVPYAIVRFLTVIGGGPSLGNFTTETGFPSEALIDGCVVAISVIQFAGLSDLILSPAEKVKSEKIKN
jgi:hypothetical protein